mmetsp:Transcript_9606/g.20786  ORF Transcript_9606/g.20786 Transcript_9606/m.20786 type:complete len:167 (+) Transcript_9606:523-1023(+)
MLTACSCMYEKVIEITIAQLGFSNFYAQAGNVQWAYDIARINPKVLQNSFHTKSGHDVELRSFFKEHDIEYQSFYTLNSNRDAYHHEAAVNMATEKGLSPEALFFSFVMALGISPLVGTTNEEYMKDDMILMSRIRSGEKIIANSEELAIIGNALGSPDWEVEDEL